MPNKAIKLNQCKKYLFCNFMLRNWEKRGFMFKKLILATPELNCAVAMATSKATDTQLTFKNFREG